MAGKITNDDIKSVAELTGLGAGAPQLPNDDKVYVTANGINKTLKQAIIDGDIGGTPTSLKETLTLSAGDASAQLIDLAVEASANSIRLHVGRTPMFEGIDYTTSVVSGPVTEIDWSGGDFAVGGPNEIVEGDVLYVEYIQA